ncbi:predicted protein [Aspergillus nidulans FGSC A4]|uniref:Uncharacterized protein n=1 Tax=Emericella nidulans (strain FGSC A4 / ATCC 38163 / CBS 112.46 / NRRL 194 / M139) TaxID=227321 RepID=Q5BEW5_EMENI|nr:hypothetical protein [Aspergillus nidulans FGSC A4]EAA65944.1 predicted protein [Aspergillus nidulans FGSC A4]CBF88534.1 TPA: conserved hypothetical protein [Aspergillus nidulans FGSC A4]|eukprot:XP_658519.1 predicted protein [Aspergillus nidulans FGSC A4]
MSGWERQHEPESTYRYARLRHIPPKAHHLGPVSRHPLSKPNVPRKKNTTGTTHMRDTERRLDGIHVHQPGPICSLIWPPGKGKQEGVTKQATRLPPDAAQIGRSCHKMIAWIHATERGATIQTARSSNYS